MSYIKKLTIEIEDSEGNVSSTDIDGVYVTDINIERPYYPYDYRSDRFIRSGPDEITIKMLVYGGMWVGVTKRPQGNLPPKPPQLTSSQKQLPEHKDE